MHTLAILGIGALIEKITIFLRDLVVNTIQWIADTVFSLIIGGINWLLSLLPESVTGTLNRAPLAGWTEYINAVDYFIPVKAALGIFVVGLTAAASIRLFRWIKASWPGLLGGGGSS